MNTFACSPPSSTCSSSIISVSSQLFPRNSPVPAAAPPRSRRRGSFGTVLAASRRGDAYGAGPGGWLVDEDMIVLRKRLHEMRAAETNYRPPSHWMEWEKRYYAANYVDDVCRLVGLLQEFLVNARPGVAVGLLALLALSVPTSAAVVVLKLAEVLA
ncbi:hypothetical protein Taro_050179 [Colocasia esculenta]|uniref:Uncharacterized protein n=1 Tax=Colocasia esculenta TaxID=4460 RepID=A0A843XCT1_COLES|nr:hypothetical protein [Colocasia esculenta]